MPEQAKINPFREDWRPVINKVVKAVGAAAEAGAGAGAGAYKRNIMADAVWLAQLLETEHPGKRLKELSKEQFEAFVLKAAQWGKDNGKFAAKPQ
jgi:hypothetical protein